MMLSELKCIFCLDVNVESSTHSFSKRIWSSYGYFDGGDGFFQEQASFLFAFAFLFLPPLDTVSGQS